MNFFFIEIVESIERLYRVESRTVQTNDLSHCVGWKVSSKKLRRGKVDPTTNTGVCGFRGGEASVNGEQPRGKGEGREREGGKDVPGMGGMEGKKKSRNNVVEEGVCAVQGGSSLLIRLGRLGRVGPRDWCISYHSPLLSRDVTWCPFESSRRGNTKNY